MGHSRSLAPLVFSLVVVTILWLLLQVVLNLDAMFPIRGFI